MIKQDFILRIIEQLAQALARILKLHERGENDAALAAIDDALAKFVGLDLAVLESMSLPALLALLKPGIDLDITKTVVVADLLKARGDVRESMGDLEGSLDTRIRALTLFLEVFTGPNPVKLPDQLARTEELIAKVDDYELPPETAVRLVRHFERTGRYARAEDALFDLVESGEADEGAFDVGRAFYDRVLRKTDAELEAGDLPRDEAADGLARLRAAEVEAFGDGET